MSAEEVLPLLASAFRAGVRLEVVGATPMWERVPSEDDVEVANSIRRSSKGGFWIMGTPLWLPDGSLRFPDLMIYAVKPETLEIGAAMREVPSAVIEVFSSENLMKDLLIGPNDYLGGGVQEIIVVDPRSGVCTHFRPDGATTRHRGDTALLECGCGVTL